MRNLLKNLLAVLVGCAMAVCLLEATLRLIGFTYPRFYQPDPFTGSSHRPTAEGRWTSEGNAWIKINSAGFRGREYEVGKPSKTFRIVILGDSMTEAFQVDIEDTFGSQIERRLGDCKPLTDTRIESLNFGVAGFGTTQSWIRYRRTAVAYDANLVLLAFTPGNDVRNNSRSLEQSRMRPFAVLDNGNLRIDRTFINSELYQSLTGPAFKLWRSIYSLRVAQAVSFIFHRFRHSSAARTQLQNTPPSLDVGLNGQVFAPPQEEVWIEAWQVTEAVITQLREDVVASGAHFMLTSVSTGGRVDPDPAVSQSMAQQLSVEDLFYPERRLSDLADRLAIPYVALAPQMARKAITSSVYFHGFDNASFGRGHWNADGHHVAGKILAESICALLETKSIGEL